MAENTIQTLSQEELAKLVLAQSEKIAHLELQIAGKNAIDIKEAAKESKPKLPASPVSHEGKKYQFILPAFRIEGDEFTAEQAAVDKSIMAKILAIKGQNIVKELV